MAKAPETLFTFEWFLSTNEMILNWFTFPAFSSRYQYAAKGHKNTFSRSKDDDIFNGNYFSSYFHTPDAALPIIFLIYLFLMAAFRHFLHARVP